ncbi:MAG: DUF1080 domain-containing protein [Planctomycetaceae bacterium]
MGGQASTSERLAAAPKQASTPEAISPKDGVIKLFNGKNLEGLYTYLNDTKYEDPRGVFLVEDGMLHISGDGLGGITTKNDYRDYHLVCEFKWGMRTWRNREKSTKDSGILVHGTGPDGTYGGNWPASIEAQIIEGGCGDFIVVGGTYADGSKVPMSLTCEVIKDRDGEDVWQAGAPRKSFSSGRVNWYGRDPDWSDVLGFRGKNDVESPDGQWTRMDVVCDGGHISNYVNGVKVNEGFDTFPASGRILIQTELAEIWVRRWELWPLGKAPKFEPLK